MRYYRGGDSSHSPLIFGERRGQLKIVRSIVGATIHGFLTFKLHARRR